MSRIKYLSKEELKKLSTLKLVDYFNSAKYSYEELSEYLSSDTVRNCDAYNTLQEIHRKEDKKRDDEIYLSMLNKEIIYRACRFGKKVDFYDKDGNIINSYVLPKTNQKGDDIAFIICKDNNVFQFYEGYYRIYSKRGIENLGYRIDRKKDNSINWKDSSVIYDSIAYELCDECYCVKLDDKYGVINEEGTLITPIKYDWIEPFDYNFAKVKLADKWSVIDKKGHELTDFEYDRIELFRSRNHYYYKEDRPIIVFKNKKAGAIDKNNNTILSVKYDFISYFSDDLLEAHLDNKITIFDLSGNTIIPLVNNRIYYFSENLIQIFSTNGTCGLINIKGEEVAPPIYTWIDSIKHDLIMVNYDYSYGFLDTEGKEVIPPIYSQVRVFDKELIKVTLDGKCGLFDRKGNVVIPIEYDDLTFFNYEVIKFKLGEECGFINRKGEKVISPKDKPFVKDFSGRDFEDWKYTGR